MWFATHSQLGKGPVPDLIHEPLGSSTEALANRIIVRYYFWQHFYKNLSKSNFSQVLCLEYIFYIFLSKCWNDVKTKTMVWEKRILILLENFYFQNKPLIFWNRYFFGKIKKCGFLFNINVKIYFLSNVLIKNFAIMLV